MTVGAAVIVDVRPPIADDELEQVRRRLRATGLYARVPSDPATRAGWQLYGAADGAPTAPPPLSVLPSTHQTQNAAPGRAALLLRTDREN